MLNKLGHYFMSNQLIFKTRAWRKTMPGLLYLAGTLCLELNMKRHDYCISRSRLLLFPAGGINNNFLTASVR